MKETIVSLDPAFTVGAVDPRIFGGFLEHLGRAVYEGVYDPDSPQADEDGFRMDVIEVLRRLRMTAMRYPGGNFASGYHWMDGVGPRDKRPAVRDLAWQSLEPNRFGTDEYVALCRKAGWTPMVTVNLGTGTPEEARNWVEYCNSPVGSRYADMRAANGSRPAHNVKLWCLGNEMDGQWQLGHVPAGEYGIRAQQAAKMMKDTDGSIEVVACGTCGVFMPTYMEWDRQVLDYMGDLADYVSLHRYVGNEKKDVADFLAVGASIDKQIEEMDAVCRFVQAKRRSKKRACLCFDEWNVWYKNHEVDGAGKYAPNLLEEIYDLEDALVVAQFLNSFIRHADVLKIANLAQIVNVIAPILTTKDRVLVQSIFYPFEMFSSRREGTALRVAASGPEYESKSYGIVKAIDASAVLGDGQLHVFLVNRGKTKATVRIDSAGTMLKKLESAEIVSGTNPMAANSFKRPDVVRSKTFGGVRVARGKASVSLPGYAVAAMTFRV